MEIKDSYLKNDHTKFIIPLQKPYEIDKSLENFDYFAIGGMVNPGGTNLNITHKRRLVQTIVGRYKDKKFHLFGVKPSTMPEVFKNYENVISSDTAIRKYTFYNTDVAQGEYSHLTGVFHTIFYIINELVGYYNYKFKSPNQKSMF